MGSSTEQQTIAKDEKVADHNNGLRQRKTGPNSIETGVASSSPTPADIAASAVKKTNFNSTTNTSRPSLLVKRLSSVGDKSVLERLFSSKEEKQYLHLHKILGFSCLISFAYRLAHVGKADGNFAPSRIPNDYYAPSFHPKDPNYATVFFVIHHFLLNASAFVFSIPQRRIKDGGYRIWPEYRIHSLVFASRALAFIFLRWWEQYNGIGGMTSPDNYWYMDLVIVLATCGFADLGSYLQHDNHSNTVRDATFSDPFENHFASEMQLFLTAFCILGYRRYTVHLLALFNIQVNSFLMTLRRKNVAPQWMLTGTYSLMLVGSGIVMLMDDMYTRRIGVVGVYGCVAVILRMQFRCNKYLLWTLLYFSWYYIRMTKVRYMYNTWTWFNIFMVLRMFCTMIGMNKRKNADPTRTSPVVGFFVYALHITFLAYICYLNRGFRWKLYGD